MAGNITSVEFVAIVLTLPILFRIVVLQSPDPRTLYSGPMIKFSGSMIVVLLDLALRDHGRGSPEPAQNCPFLSEIFKNTKIMHRGQLFTQFF